MAALHLMQHLKVKINHGNEDIKKIEAITITNLKIGILKRNDTVSIFFFNNSCLLHKKKHVMVQTWLNPDLKASTCLEIPLFIVASTTSKIYSSKLLILTW